MKLAAIEELHGKSIDRLRELKDGHGPYGLGGLVEAARNAAIAEVCAAIRKDFASATKIPDMACHD